MNLKCLFLLFCLNLNPANAGNGFTVIVYENDGTITENAGVYTLTQPQSKLIKYEAINPYRFQFTLNNTSIRDIDIGFYENMTTTTPIDVAHYNLIFYIDNI